MFVVALEYVALKHALVPSFRATTVMLGGSVIGRRSGRSLPLPVKTSLVLPASPALRVTPVIPPADPVASLYL